MRKLLLPLSWVYGFFVALRNLAFDKGWMKAVAFEVPVVVIGNLSAGGTGKSPLVQLLARRLAGESAVAILSRGYGRTTKGFRRVSKMDVSRQCGDEPLQYVHTLEGVTVAVCEDRVEGIRTLLSAAKPPDVILLDDAFQHRYVKPGYAVLLTDFNDLYVTDVLLPAGNLREPAAQAKRADVIVVTKCPPDLSLKEQQNVLTRLNPLPHQMVYFSYIHYREPVLAVDASIVSFAQLADKHLLVVCGIAKPESLLAYLRPKVASLRKMVFPDHHPFSVGDVIRMKSEFEGLSNSAKGNCFLLTTRKDYMRLLNPELQHLLKGLPLLILDIEPAFLPGAEIPLEERIRKYIGH